MLIRLIAIVVVGVYVGGYLPRALTTGQHGWVLWLVAAAIVFGAPPALRFVGRRAAARVRLPAAIARRRNAGGVSR